MINSKNGTTNVAVPIWMYRQSWSHQQRHAYNIPNTSLHGRNLNRDRDCLVVNSKINVKFTEETNPHPMPIKNLSAANICQDVEKAAAVLNTNNADNAEAYVNLRPIVSAICPEINPPAITPPICNDVMVDGIQLLSHTRSH